MAKAAQNPAQNIIAIAVVVILAAFGSAYMYVIPQLTTARTALKTAQAKAEGVDADIQTLKSAQTALQAQVKALQAKGVDFTTFESVDPPTEDMPGLYIQFESIALKAKQIGLTVNDSTYSNPVVGPGGGARIPVNFSVTGQYENLRKFIDMAETNSRPLIITSLTISQATKTPAAGGSSGSSNSGTFSANSTTNDLTMTLSCYVVAQAISPAYQVPLTK
jgi:Tfp pilus assembly protein PilO